MAVGAVLLQKNEQPTVALRLYCTSRKLSETEQKWAVWEKEAYTMH